MKLLTELTLAIHTDLHIYEDLVSTEFGKFQTTQNHIIEVVKESLDNYKLPLTSKRND